MIGEGYSDRLLTEQEVRNLVSAALERAPLDGKRVLMLVPDHTRTAPIPLMFRAIYGVLARRVRALDVLIALGTHPRMSIKQIRRLVGITAAEHETDYPKARFFNHAWDDPKALEVVGVIPEELIDRITGGVFRMSVNVTVNRMVRDYDHLMIVGPVFPHEVAGFSGGNKYIFPGIAGQEIIHFFHWLGALITNPVIIGTKWTAVREVIDTAASYIRVEKSAFSLVVNGGGLAGLWYGSPEESWSAAVDLSDRLHIVYKDRPFRVVLSCAPEMYDDIWTAGKCMYKLEPVVADRGTLIIYAPHITEISYTHGKILDEIGYHTRDYFTKQWDTFKHRPWGVVAHSTHVKGIGTFEDGVERPRVDVILATGIPEERCRRVNLGYMDPADVKIEDYKGREDEGILYVPKAGETLYRLRG